MTEVPPGVLVGLGGSIGALARFGTTRALDRTTFPYGTFAVNVLGSFLLGVVAAGAPSGSLHLFVGVGACGAFTTFSSFAYDTVDLVEAGAFVRAAANAVGTLVAALAGIGLAWLLVP